LKQEATLARESFAIYASALITAASVEREDADPQRYQKDITEFLAEAEKMLSAIPENRASITSFRTAVENLPRITIQFNQAKKLLLEALNECLQLFDHTEQRLYEITAKT